MDLADCICIFRRESKERKRDQKGLDAKEWNSVERG